MLHRTPIGHYYLVISGNRARITFMRFEEFSRFCLREVLGQHNLKVVGKFEVKEQSFLVYREKRTERKLYGSYLEKIWLLLTHQPLSQVTWDIYHEQLEGKQWPVCPGEFMHARTIVTCDIEAA